jgi:argininosuccinate lyase
LPLAYNRDLQEDKPPLFDAMDAVLPSLELAAATVAGAELDGPRIRGGLERGYLDATTLMERAIAFGAPMRSAHESVGRLVRRCDDEGKTLAELPAAAFDEAFPGKGAELRAALGAEAAAAAFATEGSTAPARVRERLQHWRRRLSQETETTK